MQAGYDQQMRRARTPEVALHLGLQSPSITQDHGQEYASIWRVKRGLDHVAQCTSPMVDDSCCDQVSRTGLQVDTTRIAQPTNHMQALPVHEPLEIEAAGVTKTAGGIEP
jgi:hypothetical protein